MVAVEIGLLPWLSPSHSGLPPRPPPKKQNITQRRPCSRQPASESALMVRERAAVGALRRGLGERAEDHVDHAQDGLGVAADRARRRDAEQRRVGNDEFDRREAAGIGRHVGEQVLQRDVAARDRGRARDVERPVAGRRRAREVERHAVARDGQVERDAERLVGDAVIVEEVVEASRCRPAAPRCWRASAPRRAPDSAASAAVMVSSPYSSSSACSRRSPRSSALSWPLRSPQFDCGTREFAARMSRCPAG